MQRWLFWVVVLSLFFMYCADLAGGAPVAAFEVVWCIVCILLLVVTEEIR